MPLPEETITEEVRRLYEQYPFPGPYASEKPPVVDGTCSYTWVYYHAMHAWRSPRGRRILDAGCGTGETLRRYALNNPGTSLAGYDLSQAALDLAAEKLRGVPDVDFVLERRDLLQLAPSPQPFDLISCTGVLHHTADPVKALRNLVACLAPDGIMSVYLYAAYARREIEMASQIIRMLCGPREDMARRVEVTRRFLQSLPPRHFLLETARTRFDQDLLEWIERDEHLADMFLHPREVLYTFDQVLELLDAAGLELVRFYDEHEWDLRRLLPDPELRRRTMFMGRRQKDRLADLLNPRPAYVFVARRQDFVPPRPPQADEIHALVPMVAPVVSWVLKRPAAALSAIPPDTIVEVAGFTSHSYRLDHDAVEALALCDGVRTVDEIALARGTAAGQSDEVARGVYRRLFATLEKQGIVLFKRPGE